MKTVITGAGGYIGTELVRRLDAQDVTVVALTRAGTPDKFRCIRSGVTGSLRQHMDGADGLVHLAGRLVDDPRAGVSEYLGPNVAFTDSVMSSAVDAGVRVVVHASSRLVYPGTLTEPAAEEDARPDTPYGLSKQWSEDVVRYHCDRSGISGISLRIAQVTGGDHPGLGVVNRFIGQGFENGVIRVLGAGSARRDIVHVRDVADAMARALDYRGPWVPINLGGSGAVTIEELAEAVARSIGLDATRIVHEETPNEDRSCYALRQDRMRRVLAWSPLFSAEDIITEACSNWEK